MHRETPNRTRTSQSPADCEGRRLAALQLVRNVMREMGKAKEVPTSRDIIRVGKTARTLPAETRPFRSAQELRKLFAPDGRGDSVRPIQEAYSREFFESELEEPIEWSREMVLDNAHKWMKDNGLSSRVPTDRDRKAMTREGVLPGAYKLAALFNEERNSFDVLPALGTRMFQDAYADTYDAKFIRAASSSRRAAAEYAKQYSNGLW